MTSASVPEWTLGDRMRKALLHGGISVEAMGEYLGYSTATMRNWTHDRAQPRPSVLRQWALRCGVPYEWLATGSAEGGNTVTRREQGSKTTPNRGVRTGRAA